MDIKTIIAIALVVFVLGSGIFLYLRNKRKYK